MVCIIRLGQPRLLDIVDDAWAQDTLPDDDISIPQVYSLPRPREVAQGVLRRAPGVERARVMAR
jgi:hypothetical protein